MRKAGFVLIALGTLGSAGWLIWIALDRLDEANNPVPSKPARSLVVPAADLPAERRSEAAEISSAASSEPIAQPKKIAPPDSHALDQQRQRLEATLHTIRAHIDELQSKIAALHSKESNVGAGLREKQQAEASRENLTDANVRGLIANQQFVIQLEIATLNSLKGRKDSASKSELANARRALDRAKAKLSELRNRERSTDQQLTNQRQADRFATQSRVASLEQTAEQINIALQNERARYETVLAQLHALNSPKAGGAP